MYSVQNGRTALWSASKGLHVEVVNALLENGADVNAADKEFITPLHLGAAAGMYDIVDSLLRFGAERTAKDQDKAVAAVYHGRYELFAGGGELPQGGQNIIRKAVHRDTGSMVALKFFKDKDARERTLEALKKLLDRKYIVQLAGSEEECVFDVPTDEAKGTPAFYALALTCGSRSLQEELDRKETMSVHIAGARFRNVVEAVSYMHGKKWAHLDLKPANIVLFDSELQHNMKLIDLDSSCNLRDETQVVRDLGDKKLGSWRDDSKKGFRLYLVCELSGELQGDGFQIDMAMDWVKKVLPAMKAGFKLVWLVSSTLKVGKAFSPAMLTGVDDKTLDAVKQYLLRADKDQLKEAGLTGMEGGSQARSLVLWASQSAINRVKELSLRAADQLDACRNGINITIAASPAAPATTTAENGLMGSGQQQPQQEPQPQEYVQKRVLRQILETFQAQQVDCWQAMAKLLEQAGLDDEAVAGDGQQQQQQQQAARTLPCPMVPLPMASGVSPPAADSSSSPPPVSLLDADLDQLMKTVCIPQLDGSFPRLADCDHVWPKSDVPGDDVVYFLPMAAITLPLAGCHSLPLTLLSCFGSGGEQQEAEKRSFYLTTQVQGPVGISPAASATSSSSSTAASHEVHVGLQLPAGSPAGLPNRAISLHPVDYTGAAHDEPHRHPLAPMALAAMCVEGAVYSASLFSKYCNPESVEVLYDRILKTLRACFKMAAEEATQALGEQQVPLRSSLAAANLVNFGQLIEEVGKRKKQKMKAEAPKGEDEDVEGKEDKNALDDEEGGGLLARRG
ncbi:hypothetical protein GPECTOR_24g214 [Gonium pectorale]|uniref:Protein kinase domain-containing protein n=1 Tax=Gonium pectorale TaxID=33097 RepID=A0A150GH23_GONPE|nr:hypothetical protein GPECTOR_24g214 [Gonium pectorale]|eukprot:KXZ48925.1 hypothetical protein GPECTOR_24g214 [Gonium pectorale]